MIQDKQTIRISAFGGMDNRTPETRLAASLQRLLVNLDVAEGKLQQRPGYVLAQELPGAHSLWSDGRRGFCAAQGTLYSWNGIEAPVALRTGVFGAVSYAAVNGEAYWSDGTVTGKIRADGTLAAWGLPTPATPTVTATAAGGLTAGTYQVALTWQNATGEESGAAVAATVQVAQGGGIAVGLEPPSDADVQFVSLYVSAPDSANLYHALLVPASMGSLLIGAGQRGRELDSQFLAPMPAGALVRFWRGRLVTVQGNVVTFSEALRYGLTDARYGFLVESADITLLEPVAGGLFIGTAEGVRFAAGTSPDNFSFTEVERGAPVPGTGISVDARDLGLNVTGPVAVWLSPAGWVYGLPDGTTSTPVADRLALPGYEQGASLMIEQDGLRRMLAVVRGAGPELAKAGDSVVAEVIRNGSVIN